MRGKVLIVMVLFCGFLFAHACATTSTSYIPKETYVLEGMEKILCGAKMMMNPTASDGETMMFEGERMMMSKGMFATTRSTYDDKHRAINESMKAMIQARRSIVTAQKMMNESIEKMQFELNRTRGRGFH